jgi:pyridoxal phosphate enzyme (YggS family)
MSVASSLDSSGNLAKKLSAARSRITAAALRYGRDPASVSLLAVTKQQSVDRVRAVAGFGQQEFGESYLQEAIPKIASLTDLSLAWHFIGQIQSNKTRLIAEHFDWAHTIDRIKIAERLNEQRPRHAAPLNICVQVKLGEESGKGGIEPAEILSLARAVVALPSLRLRGLMCIPPPKGSFDEQLIHFEEVAGWFRKLLAEGFAVDTLSMGMSADLEAAIAAGATIVRVGTAIFGERHGDT